MRETATARVVNDVLTPLEKATSREGLASLAARLAEVRSWLAEDLDALEGALAGIMPEEGHLAHRAAARWQKRCSTGCSGPSPPRAAAEWSAEQSGTDASSRAGVASWLADVVSFGTAASTMP